LDEGAICSSFQFAFTAAWLVLLWLFPFEVVDVELFLELAFAELVWLVVIFFRLPSFGIELSSFDPPLVFL
jgi:hypothetical protein